jgi:hypothetical protein
MSRQLARPAADHHRCAQMCVNRATLYRVPVPTKSAAVRLLQTAPACDREGMNNATVHEVDPDAGANYERP